MKTILLAIAASVILGGIAAAVLGSSQKLAYEAYSTTGARVTPTDNLVGPRWTGDPGTKRPGHSS